MKNITYILVSALLLMGCSKQRSTSGPFLDKVDIQIEIVPVPFDKISYQRQGESSSTIRQRVIKARQMQERRYTEYAGIYCNAQ